MMPSLRLVFLALVATLAAAAPTSRPRQAAATTQLTFQGAGVSFAVQAPVDGSSFQIPDALSIDFIAQEGTATCTFLGVDKAQLTVIGANTGATLAPPQTVVSGICQ